MQVDRKVEGQPYGGRPDGAALDVEGNYWVAMYEGACVLQLSPAGEVLQRIERNAQAVGGRRAEVAEQPHQNAAIPVIARPRISA